LLGILLIGAENTRDLAAHLNGTCRQWMCLQPKRAGSDSRINASICPPPGFVARAMDLTVMATAQRYGEFVADFAPECAVLHEA
jgi:hypothetical protein